MNDNNTIHDVDVYDDIDGKDVVDRKQRLQLVFYTL